MKKDFIKLQIENQEDCPRYTAKVITGVKVKSSPKWIQQRLKACGLQPINNIVDAANYVMLEMGQPIHAFDLDKVGKKIIVRRAKKGEKIKTLDDKTYKLDKDILVIADSNKPIAIAGIKGGDTTGVDKKTKNIVIEAANFNRLLTRRACQKLKLKTDASWRFENGIDPNLIDLAQERVCALIQEIAGGKVLRGMVDFYPKKVLVKKIQLNLDYVERLLGIKIPKREISKILRSLGFMFQVEVPTRRLDVSLPEDLIEEIGRIYGYGKIKSVFPRASLIPPQRNIDIFWEDRIKDILKELGFSEVYNYSFVEQGGEIEVANPISRKQKYLRPSLIPNLLKNVKDNLNNFKKIKIFELGKIFLGGQEKKMLAGLMTAENKTIDIFYQVKGVVDLMLKKLGLSNIWYDSYQPTPEQSKIDIWQKGECAEIKVDNQEIGFLGKISSEEVVAFDFDFEKLIKLASEEHEYQPISKFPAAVRDLAVIIVQGVLVEEVLNKINAAGGPLIRDVDLFDMYGGEEIPAGKKNLAFHIIFQAEDHTLTAEEIDKLMAKIVKALEKEPSWEVRK